MKRKQIHDNTHLTLEERKIIQAGIENNSTKASIARTIGKDATTIVKEIRKHRTLKPRNTFNRRDKSPGACNKCNEWNKCHLDKYIYNAEYADKEYHSVLVDYRQGINLTTKERDSIAQIIAPLLKQGQSVHQILSAHPEITQSQRTLYSYIESYVFKDFGVDNFSLKEQINRKQFKNKYKKRKEPANFEGRRYKDYLAFCLENPETPTVEMDTLYNNHIFYCDPMQSRLKPHVENNHNYVRDIIPNSYPLDGLTQDSIDLMFSHINSTPRLSLGDKSPFEVFSFIY